LKAGCPGEDAGSVFGRWEGIFAAHVTVVELAKRTAVCILDQFHFRI
jgi:hypothetical protein